jgi:hypothetical protein
MIITNQWCCDFLIERPFWVTDFAQIIRDILMIRCWVTGGQVVGWRSLVIRRYLWSCVSSCGIKPTKVEWA